MPPPGISRSTELFFTKGRVDNSTKEFFTQGKVSKPPAPPSSGHKPKPPAYSFNDFKGDLTLAGNAMSKENDKSNQRTTNLIKAVGGTAKKTSDAFTPSPLLIGLCIGGVLVVFLIIKK